MCCISPGAEGDINRSRARMVAVTGLEGLAKLDVVFGLKCSSQCWDWCSMALGGGSVVVVEYVTEEDDGYLLEAAGVVVVVGVTTAAVVSLSIIVWT